MATAKQQQAEPGYTVTLRIAGSKVKAMADAAKKIGVAVGSVEKTVSTASGQWATEWVKHVMYMNPVLVNTDGRVIQRFEVENESGDGYIEGAYTYRTRDEYGKTLGNFDTVAEAKLAVREPMTQAEILDAADAVAAHVVRYGAGDREESSGIKNAAESYLIGRGKEMPEEYDEEEEGNRRTPEFIVTLRIKASTLPTVEKKAKAAFGDKLKSVEKVGRGFSRAADLAEAQEHVEAAAEIVGELKSSMEEWRDNTPDSLQQTEKYNEVEECASNLESLEDELNGINFDVDFPRMF
jgi:hypothetical protein